MRRINSQRSHEPYISHQVSHLQCDKHSEKEHKGLQKLAHEALNHSEYKYFVNESLKPQRGVAKGMRKMELIKHLRFIIYNDISCKSKIRSD